MTTLRRLGSGRPAVFLMVVLVIVTSGPSTAVAAPSTASAADNDDGVAAAPPTAAAQDEALSRFRRGVALYEEGDFAAAEIELTRANELAPNFKLLFNLGQVAQQRRDYAAALGYLTRYLDEGGDRVPASRRLEVEDDLAELKQRVGQVGVRVASRNLAVFIDDVERGTTPLPAPLTLNVGRHRVELLRPSGERHARMVDVPGGQTVWVTFNLPRVEKPVPAAPRPERQGERQGDREGEREAGGGEGQRIARTLLTKPSPTRDEGDERDEPHPSRRPIPWVTWGLTAACAAGAAVTGAMALSTSFELQRKLDSYPVSQRELDSLEQREREFALASDGLLLGTAVLSAIALYWTMSRPPRPETKQSARAPRTPAY